MRRVLVLVLALLSGGLTWLVLSREQTMPAEQLALREELQTVEVLVVTQDLERGTILSRGVLGWQSQLKTSVSAEAILRAGPSGNIPENVVGKLLRTDVFAGEILRPSAMVEGAASFMALAVSPGMRAMAVRVTPDKLAGGYVLPDDRVDVVHTVVRDIDNDGESDGFSEVILRNIRVLAVGEEPTRRTLFLTPEQQAAANEQRNATMAFGDTVTLEVDEAAAKVLMSRAAVGNLSLALRAIEDHGAPEIVEAGFAPEPSRAPASPEAESPTPSPRPGLVETGHRMTLIKDGALSIQAVPQGAGEQDE